MKIVEANTFNKRLIGLMFKKNVNYGLLFKKCNKIHTFMMKFNLDLIIINEHNKIIDIHRDIKPNRIIWIKYPQKKTSILEIPSSTSYIYKVNDYFNL